MSALKDRARRAAQQFLESIGAAESSDESMNPSYTKAVKEFSNLHSQTEEIQKNLRDAVGALEAFVKSCSSLAVNMKMVESNLCARMGDVCAAQGCRGAEQSAVKELQSCLGKLYECQKQFSRNEYPLALMALRDTGLKSLNDASKATFVKAVQQQKNARLDYDSQKKNPRAAEAARERLASVSAECEQRIVNCTVETTRNLVSCMGSVAEGLGCLFGDGGKIWADQGLVDAGAALNNTLHFTSMKPQAEAASPKPAPRNVESPKVQRPAPVQTKPAPAAAAPKPKSDDLLGLFGSSPAPAASASPTPSGQKDFFGNDLSAGASEPAPAASASVFGTSSASDMDFFSSPASPQPSVTPTTSKNQLLDDLFTGAPAAAPRSTLADDLMAPQPAASSAPANDFGGLFAPQTSAPSADVFSTMSFEDPNEVLPTDADIERWKGGKVNKNNLRMLLSTLHTVLWRNSGWKEMSLGELIDASSVKKAYFKAINIVHSDKVVGDRRKDLADQIFHALHDANVLFLKEVAHTEARQAKKVNVELDFNMKFNVPKKGGATPAPGATASDDVD